MKKSAKNSECVWLFLYSLVFLISSCKKNPDNYPVSSDHAPVADAGADKTVKLPTNGIELGGSGTDLDGDVKSFLWVKLSGPSTYAVINPKAAVTKVENLVEGVYGFEFQVLDEKL